MNDLDLPMQWLCQVRQALPQPALKERGRAILRDACTAMTQNAQKQGDCEHNQAI